MSEVVLRVENLSTGYGEVQILWGVSIQAKKGQLTTIIGSNGSGKTTLLRAITGILPVWEGKIWFNGEDITDVPAYKRADMGLVMVPEGRMLFPEMTVYENLEMGAFNKRARAKFKESLDFVLNLFPRLKERLYQKAGTMSGGEQQMVALGRGLMACPELLILDEPSLGLAPKLVLEVFEIIKKLRDEGITMLLVEQNVHLSLMLTDWAYVMAEGRIVMEGTGRELEQSDEVRKAYLGI
ncbi:branched-chain amino acid transport system ATP-binding protein [Thermosulfidibacter takaii ABI70S6]|uniref:Branched-chain amino acid transport system ATP-binding protein n=1 Tax=Thermosulfidibacter takaii (strain DSM 17441 / JCM 13301 / NBRC 103674 / ABI70S6) TaxID=1298851 RepID=A0A0S3QVS7_THET7|nr:ABC transporter ATP-binding protein [Thermosulfidibacter takaii]BAT72435.1 branched-chain amino acid transport system ATP-binding protein [Thermosulfidibacter takaii ABI70S6]